MHYIFLQDIKKFIYEHCIVNGIEPWDQEYRRYSIINTVVKINWGGRNILIDFG